MQEHDRFGESVEGLCTGLITDVQSIMHENETRRTLLEQYMEETAKLYEESKRFMLFNQKRLFESKPDRLHKDSIMLKFLKDGYEHGNKQN